MKFLLVSKLTVKLWLPLFISLALFITQGQNSRPGIHLFSPPSSAIEEGALSLEVPVAATPPVTGKAGSAILTGAGWREFHPVSFQQPPAYPFANPAGCAQLTPKEISAEMMLRNVQRAIGAEYDLGERRQTYIWNGTRSTMSNVAQDQFVYEFVFNEFQHPLTYRGDRVATIFMTQGFVVWFRAYGDNFRLLAIPMIDGVLESAWADYVQAYWQKDGLLPDHYVYPVMKKLPCHWVIDTGYVSTETLTEMFSLDWHIPDYRSTGRQYLALTCQEANKISQKKIGFWDASSMCGPLAWTIMRDANAFPYRIGSWSASAAPFTAANPKWNGQPWGAFDPETFTLVHSDEQMPGYDFASKGDLYPGDVVYSYATLYVTPGYFDHIFVVAGINEDKTRLSVSNLVQNGADRNCSIAEIPLYTPGDTGSGFINHEWNGNGFGRTGTTGFDVFRWNWITYHLNGQSISYTIRWGDTIETIAFDWKISPQSIVEVNQFAEDIQLTPEQMILLPAPSED